MHSKFIIALSVCTLCAFAEAKCQIQQHDSITLQMHRQDYLLPAIGGSLIVAGSLIGFDHGGSQPEEGYTPAFSYKADEVLRFVPAMALVGMKACGVESRTEKWSELIVRSAVSTAIMGASVEGIKRLSKRIRPDGSNDRSFPSGHTAAAFLTASLFAKEYGHQSAWYSAGAYGVATSTALLRRINDKHWVSDVMTGAGIGILSTELGYALADLFYKPTKKQPAHDKAYGPSETTSFAALYMEYTLPHALTGIVDGHQVESAYGYRIGMEAVWFPLRHIGIGGRIGLGSSPIEIDGVLQERPLDHATFTAGPYFCYPLPDCHLSLGANLRGGYGFYPQSEYKSDNGTNRLTIGGNKGWGYAAGVSLTWHAHPKASISLTAGYDHWEAPASDDMEAFGWSIGLSANYPL